MNTINNINSTVPQFRGGGLLRYGEAVRSSGISRISSILSKDEKDILELTKNSSSKRVFFFEKLADRYNSENFNLALDKQENPELVSSIFKKIKKPQSIHFDLVSNLGGSLATIGRIFDAAQNKSKRLLFAYKVGREVIGCHRNVYEGLIPELLESKNSKKYIRNLDKYKSYLKLNRMNDDVVKNLDEMVSSGTYDRKKYDSLLKHRNIMRNFPYFDSEVFNAKVYADKYTEPRGQFFDTLFEKYIVPQDIASNGNDIELAKLYDSTTKENYKLRQHIVQRYPHRYLNGNSTDNTNILLKKLNKLFDTIDTDKDAKNFVKAVLASKVSLHDAGEFNDIFDMISPAKLNIFHKNAIRLLSITGRSENRVAVLQQGLEDPFFETPKSAENRKIMEECGLAKPMGLLARTKEKLINKINIFRYNRLNEPAAVKIEAAVPEIEKPVNIADTLPAAEKVETVVPEIKKPVNTADTLPAAEKAETVVPEIKKTVNIADTLPAADKAETVVPEIKKTVNIADTLPAVIYKPLIIPISHVSELKEAQKAVDKTADKAAKKEEIRKNIFAVLTSKLRKQTFSRQQNEYGKGATKMRLSMLPEIFSSIADTRKADIAVGKHRINSSNKDVLDLYLLVNGSNKKFINYLLKKRNVDNTRMFEVKDIISMVKKAEAKIAAEKKSNPEYRARDARKYYNHLYEAKIEQYGKVKRPSKRIEA